LLEAAWSLRPWLRPDGQPAFEALLREIGEPETGTETDEGLV
jgi:hypothetical protein